MKKFISKTIFFLLPIFVLAVIMEVALRAIPNDYKQKRSDMDSRSDEIEILVLGSSHSLYGINPKYFSQNTYNVAYVSQSLDLDYKILEKYGNEFKNLNVIIVDISYFSLYSTLETGPEPWRAKNYNIYYDISTSKATNNFEVLTNKLDINYSRMKSYYTKKIKNDKAFIDSTFTTKMYDGWISLKPAKTRDDLEETGVAAAKRHTYDIAQKSRVEIHDELTNVLGKIVDWSKQKNVKVVFVTTPTYKTYYDRINTVQWDNTHKIIENICRKNSNCQYINLLKNEGNLFTEKDFSDADHLSETGAEKMSKLINKLLTSTK
jgi:hypothetical protein ilyop_0805